jgi:hypothetical protein
VSRIDWVEQAVHVSLTRDQLRHSPNMEEANVPSHELTPGFVIM